MASPLSQYSGVGESAKRSSEQQVLATHLMRIFFIVLIIAVTRDLLEIEEHKKEIVNKRLLKVAFLSPQLGPGRRACKNKGWIRLMILQQNIKLWSLKSEEVQVVHLHR